jgi:endoglucanase
MTMSAKQLSSSPAGLVKTVSSKLFKSGRPGSNTASATPTRPWPQLAQGGKARPPRLIVIDQFGYLPTHRKVAVLREPQCGFDASDLRIPNALYEVVNAENNAVVFCAVPTPWRNGATDASSGDRTWHFDFSAVSAEGTYFIRDLERTLRSASFTIGADVYQPILRTAVRYFFYQRAGHEKLAVHAGADWADGASHLGPDQDRQARLFSAPYDAATERDLSGGWFDGGDFNRYTSWSAGYIVDLLHAYIDNPLAWGEDLNIPESGNGVPDLINEIKWGMDWLVRMQEADGSVLSILGVDHASPPSTATGPSTYGPASTSATLAAAGAYAFGATVFATFQRFRAFAADLRRRAESAWKWALANPKQLFRNNDARYGSMGLGEGQQETDDYGRLGYKLAAAIHLFELTGNANFRAFIDARFRHAHIIMWNYVDPSEPGLNQALLYHASLPSSTKATADTIRRAFVCAMDSRENWGAVTAGLDPYMAYLKDYGLGSNGSKASQGNLFADLAKYGLGDRAARDNMSAASHFLHYLHGVNPLGKVYLSNMRGFGAENSVSQLHHTWFAHRSSRWGSGRAPDTAPPPGFLVGGPNPNCIGLDEWLPATVADGNLEGSPPHAEPPQKSYPVFCHSGALLSWAVSANSNGYQSAYIRLLARFVRS